MALVVQSFEPNVTAQCYDDLSGTRRLSPDLESRRLTIKIDCGKQEHAEFNKEMEKETKCYFSL